MTHTTRAENDKRLRELILYVATLSEGDPQFGRVKLNKLLFYCDFEAYVMFGQPITGQPYHRMPLGPGPKRFLTALDALKDRGDAAERVHDFHGYPQNRVFALREPDLDSFAPKEIDLINQIVHEFRGVNATEISDKSHGLLVYASAREKEEIPYEAALVYPRDLTPAEIEYGLRLEKTILERQNATPA